MSYRQITVTVTMHLNTTDPVFEFFWFIIIVIHSSKSVKFVNNNNNNRIQYEY